MVCFFKILLCFQVLEESRSLLVKKDLSRYIPYLKSKYIISRDDQDEIQLAGTTKRKNDKIVDILLMRGPEAYDHLCAAMLEEKVDANVVITLNVALENKISAAFAGTDALTNK